MMIRDIRIFNFFDLIFCRRRFRIAEGSFKRGGETVKRTIVYLFFAIVFFAFTENSYAYSGLSVGTNGRPEHVDNNEETSYMIGSGVTRCYIMPDAVTVTSVELFKVGNNANNTSGQVILRSSNSSKSYPFTVIGVNSRFIQINTADYTEPVQEICIYQNAGQSYTMYIGEIGFNEYVLPPDFGPPLPPKGLFGTAGDTKVNLYWQANLEEDLDGYYVYRDGQRITGIIKTTSYEDSGLTNFQIYNYYVTAVDIEGNESQPSNEIELMPENPPDETPPSPPVLSASVNEKEITLSWTAPPEDDVAGYYVYRDGVRITSEIQKNRTYYTQGDPGIQYSFNVTAIDFAGNESEKSNTVFVEIIDEMTVNLVPNADSIVIQVTGGKPPYSYTVSGNGETLSGEFSQTQFVVKGLEPDTDYTVTIIDSEGTEYTQTINTGHIKNFVPPALPNPSEIFQKMLDSFGTSGWIAHWIIMAAVALGVIVILGIWGWRMAKRWLMVSR